ncbi:hypothetical protein Pa4123_23730 [Phytohabitans aurantiacus]|uniref:Secreted protein n=1 Tax=Phytohabitans aurantiacus TaxID=3016789 RepID=A0ABQ5QS79_9ACTN|nr:hypothetical protein Pa4123_23730 [Phytohabitans aurantiacus]
MYAATARPVHTAAWSAGAICTASQATATMLMPSPSADTASPGRIRRNKGWLSAGPNDFLYLVNMLVTLPPARTPRIRGDHGNRPRIGARITR